MTAIAGITVFDSLPLPSSTGTFPAEVPVLTADAVQRLATRAYSTIVVVESAIKNFFVSVAKKGSPIVSPLVGRLACKPRFTRILLDIEKS